MGLIYKITNQVNNKVYIGKTERSFDIRKNEHLKDCWEKDNKLYRAMRKYGIENFIFEIIEDKIPTEILSQKEQEYIRQYNSYYLGYNATFGGEGESKVDRQLIEKLFLENKNCSDIQKITGYNSKTIANCLKSMNYQIQQHTGKNSNNKNGTEKKVRYLNLEFDSYTELAMYLKTNIIQFKDYNKNTLIQGISRSIKKNTTYYGMKFYPLS